MGIVFRAGTARVLWTRALALSSVWALCSLIAASPAEGLLRRVGLDELTRRADAIVVATAVASSSRWVGTAGDPVGFRGLIVTDVRLRVCRVLKGQVRDVVRVTVPGGTVGDLSLRPPDAARFRRGVTYVVFVSANGGVLGWRQGNPAIVDGRVLGMGRTLAAVERRVAALLGAPAVLLRPLPAAARAKSNGGSIISGLGVPAAAAAAVAGQDDAIVGPVGEASRAVAGFVRPSRIADIQVPLNVAVAWAARDEAAAEAGASQEDGAGADSTAVSASGVPRSLPRQPTLVWANGFEGSGAVRPNGQAGAVWWTAVGAGQAPYNWTQTGVRASEGSLSAYCCTGTGVAAPGPYRDNMAAWMWTAGTINLSGYTQGTLYFDYFLNSQQGPDGLWVMVNRGDDNSQGLFFSGDYRVWNRGLLNLANVPGLGNVCGCATVRIAFSFVSDGATTAEGAYVDNVGIACGTGPTITGITPNQASAGTGSNVTVSGSGFGATPGAVAFFYKVNEPLIGAPIVSWTDTSVVCTVPIGTINDYAASAGSGPVHVVDSAGRQSNEDAFYATFSYDGTRWPTSHTYFRVNAPSTAFRSAVLAAVDEWSKAGSPFRFVYDGRCRTLSHRGLDSHNDVFWASLGDASVIGCAWPFYRKGHLVEGDICMNTDLAWGDGLGGTMDVQTTALHELGHWLDLRDLYGDWDAHKAMYGFGDAGFLTRTPCSCDAAGIVWIYSAVRADTKRPRTIAYRSTGRSGGRTKIYFKIKDPAPSIGWATARIIIRDRGGRVVGKLSMRNPRVETNRLGYWLEPRCPLARGVYRFSVYARDIDGHA
jgi:hypothetical protein